MAAVVFSPLVWLAIILLISGWSRSKAFLLFRLVALGLCWLLLMPAGANALVLMIERFLPNAPICPAVASGPVVVLMGGLLRQPESPGDFSALTPQSLRRVAVGVEVARRQPDQVLIFSGGVGSPSEAELAAALAEKLAPGLRFLTENRSTSTWDNATQLKRHGFVGDAVTQMITSAMHAPRAALAFRAQGLPVCRHVLDSDFLAPGGLGYWVPQASALVKSNRSIHELLGYLYYTLRSKYSPPLIEGATP